MKRLFASLLMGLALFLSVAAQQLTPLPLKPEVKSGVLPNGLSYYILHNEEPKERANFYIAQKVGSTLEQPDQLGLAHFLEHMAFNGTTHYPGKAMLNYLQSKGIRFGADINAYTAFDETVYNIDNVPTTDKALMDSVLLVLRDWSDGIALEEDEINSERGVIQEEWRSRNDASTRMYTTILPKIYKEYQYQQMPIGSMDVVMNFKPEVIRDYYKTWYRPDQQGIIVVGDFDADEMERKVVDLFSTVVMPENAKERVYPVVSDNVEPIYVTFTDAELPNPSIMVMFKQDKTPFEYRNTIEAYLQDNVLESLIATVINERLNEAFQKPECQFAYAGVSLGNYMVSKTKAALMVYIIPKADPEAALKEAMAIVASACKGGFNETELGRAREQMLSNYEKMFNERNNTRNGSYGKELIRHFVDNEPAPGIEAEYELLKNVLPSLPVEAINQMLPALLTKENEVIVVSLPETEGMTVPQQEAMVGAIANAIDAEYEAKVEEVITEPLIAKLPKPGKVSKQSFNKDYDATELTLSNGVKVIVKTTDFKSDEIQMQAFRKGGKQLYGAADGVNAQFASDAIDVSNLGKFDPTTLKKYLAGKNVSLGFDIARYTDILDGSSNVKDLPALMELIYATFTDLNANQESFEAYRQQIETFLANMDKNPQKIFQDQMLKTVYGNNPLMNSLRAADLAQLDYLKSLAIAQKALSNAADYTFIFTGNVDAETLKPLLEQYIATLPSKKKPGNYKNLSSVEAVAGPVVVSEQFNSQVPSVFVFNMLKGNNVPFNTKNAIMTDLAGDILDIIYTETLREEEGGTYGASVGGMLNPSNGQWMMQYYFQTNHDQKQALMDRAVKEYTKLFSEGASAEHFNKVKEAAVKQYEINSRTNAYWNNAIMGAERGHSTLDYGQVLYALTLEDLNAFLKQLYTNDDHIEVITEMVTE